MPSLPFKIPRIGDYPVDYNIKVHGPYDPARYYGKREYRYMRMRVLGSYGSVSVATLSPRILFNHGLLYRRPSYRGGHGATTPDCADVPLGQVKVSELGQWIIRRNKGPRAIAGLFSRAHWRWQHKYIMPKYAGMSGIVQFAVSLSIFFYILNIGKIREHKTAKYHW